MRLLWQKVKVRLKVMFCDHHWNRMSHKGLPGEPYYMKCHKCQDIQRLDYLLTDNRL